MKEIFVYKEYDQIKNRAAVKRFFDEMPNGKNLLIQKKANKRTLPQNDYFHGVLFPEFKNALRSVGYDEVKTNEQAKEIVKKMFLVASVTNKETGEVLEYIKNTRDLTTEEGTNLIDEVIKFAAENMNYQIPYPNEQTVFQL